MAAAKRFQEGNLAAMPIRDLGLEIAGTRLEPVIAKFQSELERVGIRRLRPHFYLSNEWGVNFGSISIAIPFYLAHPELMEFHAERTGHVEGATREDLLRYLRHEMGHVVNYAYRLYEREDWIKRFGSMTQPYEEDYRPVPFSRRYVRHLPGWYAQKHPDEDWAETFAVWMTPGSKWRNAYAHLPEALGKLEYCDQLMAELTQRDPEVTLTDRDQDVAEMTVSLDQFYRETDADQERFPPGLDGALQTIFEEAGKAEENGELQRLPAAKLILRVRGEIMANVYRWTGHFPERTRALLRHLAERAEALRQVYPADQEASVLIALTALVTGLAMNYVVKGNYLP